MADFDRADLTPMTDRQYEAHMDTVAEVVRWLLTVPVEDLLSTISRAETLGPVLEPTAYQRFGSRNLADQRRILEAALGLQRAARKVLEGGAGR
jgi:hypothetical protein